MTEYKSLLFTAGVSLVVSTCVVLINNYYLFKQESSTTS